MFGELLEWMRPTSPPRVIHGGILRAQGSPWASIVESSHEAIDVPSCSTMLIHGHWKNGFWIYASMCEKE